MKIIVIREGSGRMPLGSIVRVDDALYCVETVKVGRVYAVTATWCDRLRFWARGGKVMTYVAPAK